MDEEPSSRTDGWIETEATIVSCKRTLASSFRGSALTNSDFFIVPEYKIIFRYTVGRKTLTGKYMSHSDQAAGSTLTIAYDPKRPSRNTGSDLIQNPWLRTIAWAAGIGIAALAIWLGFSDMPLF